MCTNCKKEFKTEYHLQRHNSRKTSCTRIAIENSTLTESLVQLQIEEAKIKQEEVKMQKEIEKLKLKIELNKQESENKQKEIELKRLKMLEIEQAKTERKGSVSDYCYVITNEIYEKNNVFKFGRTACSQKELISCYSRGLPNPKILLFYQTNNASRDENHVLNHFNDYRIAGPNRKSEWLKIEFEILKEYLDNYFEIDISYDNDENFIEDEKNFIEV